VLFRQDAEGVVEAKASRDGTDKAGIPKRFHLFGEGGEERRKSVVQVAARDHAGGEGNDVLVGKCEGFMVRNARVLAEDVPNPIAYVHDGEFPRPRLPFTAEIREIMLMEAEVFENRGIHSRRAEVNA